MAALEKNERIIIAVLIVVLLSGLSSLLWFKYRPFSKIAMESFDADIFKEAVSEAPAPEAKADKVNINLAGVEDLAKIKGVGRKIARRIVDYRYRNGPYSSIDDLKKVKGVGVALFEHIKDEVTVE